MAEGTRAHECRREMISLLQDFEQRWEQKQSVLQQESETRNNQMMMDIKAMVAGLSLQNNELAGNRGQSSNTPAGNRNMAVKTEYYFEVVNVLPESRVKVAALHLEELQMSLNVMRGTLGAQTMCVAGTCGKRSLQVLIDTGSTHNFLDSHIARKVGCELVKVTGVVVEVANGQELQCEHFCKEFTWCMQNQTFTTEVFILPLDSYDLILGASWLATLGEITWNFQTLQMKFWVDNKAHVLQGQNKHYLELAVNKQIHKLQKSHQVSSMQLVWHKEYWNSSQPIQLNALHATVSTWPELQQTLQDYADVFKDLKTLPPSRSHDHRFILKEGSTC
ncbi:hypothetical protein GH714_025183 [Hevea brasiliensis]|uniref:Uncharacterized protein n=1 Tax=Hevea brasiliensis TaxID=3981 RepID=A0A6A6MKL7_HEVBR|nr:hypothetical protein GH714_025183 [Hevea brasiliensis]